MDRFPLCLVLQRCYGNTQLRLPQNHHVEDEVINSSAVLSTSRHGSDSRYLFLSVSHPYGFICQNPRNWEGKFWAPPFSQQDCGPGLHKIISWWKWLWGHASVTTFIPLLSCVRPPSLNVISLCTCLLPLFQLVASFSSMGCKVKQDKRCPCSFGISVMPQGWKLTQGYFISPFFSFSSQREEDGERRRKQKTFDFGQAELPRYTAMDAVGWVGLLLISPGNCHVFPNLTENSTLKFFKG